MTILPRMIAIAMKKYSTLPDEREAAMRMMLRNVIRLAVVHLGKSEAATLTIQTLQESGQ